MSEVPILKPVTIHVDRDVWKKFKVLCAQEEVPASRKIARIIEQYMNALETEEVIPTKEKKPSTEKFDWNHKK